MLANKYSFSKNETFYRDNIKIEYINKLIDPIYNEHDQWFDSSLFTLRSKLEFFSEITKRFNFITPEPAFYSNIYKTCDLEEIKKKWIVEQDISPLSIYVHIPYCQDRRCNYCMYKSQVLKEKNELDNSIESLVKQITFFRNVLNKQKIETLYIGGGTPSIMDPTHISVLLSTLDKNFNFYHNGERTFEVSPTTVSYDKLCALKENKINRISIGVQSLSEEILKNENRPYKSIKEIHKIVNWIHSLGFKDLNVDLMYGLKGDNGSGLIYSLIEVFKLRIPSISIYTKRFTNSNIIPSEFIQHYSCTNKVFSDINKICDFFGYVNISGRQNKEHQHLVLRNHHMLSKTYQTRFIQRLNNSCLGLGLFSQSYIKNKVSYEEIDNKPCYLVKESDCLDRVRSYIINTLYENGIFGIEEINKYFNIQIMEIFESEIRELQELGFISYDDNNICLIPNDPINVSIALKYFYKPSLIFSLLL